MDWGPVPHFCPLETLQPVWLTPEVYCIIAQDGGKVVRLMHLLPLPPGNTPGTHFY
jgi:hypothetical protein